MRRYICLVLECIFSFIIVSSCKHEEEFYKEDVLLTLREKMTVSILGDSYSTFENYVFPKTNPSFYPNNKINLTSVSQTWWDIFIKKKNLCLEYNNSYSGSTIVKLSKSSKASYISRSVNLGDPNVILVFGGTNDSWQHVSLGDFIYNNWQEQDLLKFRPAFAFLINTLKIEYPNSILVNIVNSDIEEEYKSSMEVICQHYDIYNITLKKIDIKYGHPTLKGMKSIANQISRRIGLDTQSID